MEKIKVFALGGLDECGKNMYVIEVDEDIYIIEAGYKYPDKSSPGIDLIIPNYQYILDHQDQIRGIIISHGHMDEMGALAYIFRDHDLNIPIYGTSVTHAMIRLHANRLGFNNHYRFVEIKNNDRIQIGSHEFQFFQTAHMIAGSIGFSLHTEQGEVVYSGEFIVEYNNHPKYKLDINQIAKIAERDVLLLMSESRYADHPGYTAPSHRVTPLIQKTFQDAPGRTLVALYEHNVYNLNEIVKLAIDQNKKMIFFGKESSELLETLNSVGEFIIPKNNLATMDDIFRIREQDIVIILLGNRDTLYRQIELLATGEGEEKKLTIQPNDTFFVIAPPQIGTGKYHPS